MYGKQGFLSWLLSAEKLGEEPAPSRGSGRFGDRKFLNWLLGPENLDDNKGTKSGDRSPGNGENGSDQAI